MNPKKLKIFIVDDHQVMVDGLRLVFENAGHYEVVGEAYSGTEVLKLLPHVKPDVIIMDINMPGLDGIQCTKLIKEKHPGIKVLILTMYNERTFVNQLIVAGADGCLLKSKGSKEVLAAVERLADNKSYFDSVGDFVSGDANPGQVKLGEREVEVIKLVCKGLTTAQAADKMSISEETVKTHRRNIFKKLGINNVTQLCRFAMNNGLI